MAKVEMKSQEGRQRIRYTAEISWRRLRMAVAAEDQALYAIVSGIFR